MGCGCAERRKKIKAAAEKAKTSVNEVLSGAKPITIGGKQFFIPQSEKSADK